MQRPKDGCPLVGLSGPRKQRCNAGGPRVLPAALLPPGCKEEWIVHPERTWPSPSHRLSEASVTPDPAPPAGMSGPPRSQGSTQQAFPQSLCFSPLPQARHLTPQSCCSSISKMDRIISISPGCYLDLFMKAGNILRALKIKAIDHREIVSHPVAIEMVPLSRLLLRALCRIRLRGSGEQSCTNQDINTNNCDN